MSTGLKSPFTVPDGDTVREYEQPATNKPMRELLSMEPGAGIQDRVDKNSMGHFFIGMAFGVVLMLILGMWTGIF